MSKTKYLWGWDTIHTIRFKAYQTLAGMLEQSDFQAATHVAEFGHCISFRVAIKCLEYTLCQASMLTECYPYHAG